MSAELAIVVLSYRNDETILDAVDSVLAQGGPVELVVSHSGSGEAARLLARERPDVRVTASAERRLPGAARNAGVAATRAPYVAFLSGDARARPGWVAGRLDRHRRGAQAVASAIVPRGARLPAVAGCVVTHGYRLPGIDTPVRLRYGVSYSRSSLEAHGPFPEDREIGEDTAVNARLVAAGIDIELAREVVTEQAYAPTFAGLLADQFARGRRRGRILPERRRRAALQALLEAPRGLRRARRSPALDVRTHRLAPIVAAGVLARAAGVAVGGSRRAAAPSGALR
ncbi:MAG TPA: glycosyltransferase family A protein [Thermoleophilaceae bacterium]